MILLFTPITFIEATIFFLALIAFVLAIRFFQNTRRRLQELFPDTVRPNKLPFSIDRNGFILPNKGRKKSATALQPDATKEELKMLRLQLQQQQQQLEKALAQFQAFSQKAGATITQPAVTLNGQQKLQQPQLRNDSEVQLLKQQTAHSQTLLDRLTEAEAELEDLQTTAQQTPKQAWQTTELCLELERSETRQAQLEETLLEKEEELRELQFENERLHEAIGKMREELSHTTAERQQLLKKTQFLEAVNADLHNVSVANKKLKAEMTRAAELESMMELMALTYPKCS